MAEVRRAREVLEVEREAVLAALRKNRAQNERLLARHAALRDEAFDLLARGRTAGVPVTAMANALGLSRRHVHARLALIDKEQRRKG